MAWPPSWTSQHQIEILLGGKFDPLPPHRLHPPGLHLPGCVPPLQAPGLGDCQAGYLLPGHKQNDHHNDDDDDGQDLGRQLEEIGFQKLGLRKIGFKTGAPARELKVSRVTCMIGVGSWWL